ncbi:MAG: hypothetical protein PHQ81_05545 [Methanofollis sp.]|nr:hypothetical protein [Methanofollis sp.]
MAADENDLRETIIKTHQDVQWICRSLAQMERHDAATEERLRALENWRSERAGEERRERGTAAWAGGVVGGIVAVMLRAMGWG